MADPHSSLVGDRPGRVDSRDADVKLKLNESTTVDDLRIRFDRVIKDARCPTGAECLFEGPAVISLEVTPRGSAVQILALCLLAGQPELATQSLAQHRFTLLALAPYPDVTIPVERRKYKILLRVVRE